MQGENQTLSKELNDEGIARFKDGRTREALKSFKKAEMEAKRSSDDTEKARAHHNLGLLYSIEKSNYVSSEEFFKRAIETREKLDNKMELSESYYHLGLTYERLGRLDEAIDAFDRSAELKGEANDDAQKAKILAYIGNLHQIKDRKKEASRYHKESIELMKDLKEGNPFPIGLFTLVSNVNKDGMEKEELIDYYKNEVNLPEELDLPIDIDLLVNRNEGRNRVYDSN